jgi:2-oxoisovalerate dehydrogenase E1 component alpha subunit
MKSRLSRLPLGRWTRLPSSARCSITLRQLRPSSNLSQSPDSNHVSFPGAVRSEFTTKLSFAHPVDLPAMSTYRVVDQKGEVVDKSFKPDIADEEVVRMYRDMLFVSIMDLIMFEAQRQGRISFYMVSAGEEAVCVGSASALTLDDVIFTQYREQGVFKYRGFRTEDFMNQLFANRKDAGRGRSMPVHYGSRELNIVRSPFLYYLTVCHLPNNKKITDIHLRVTSIRSLRPSPHSYPTLQEPPTR